MKVYHFFRILRRVKASSALFSVFGLTPLPFAAFFSFERGISSPFLAFNVFLRAPGFLLEL